MTALPFGFLSALQEIGPALCTALCRNDQAGLIIAAPEGSCLDIIMRCVAAGAPRSVMVTAWPENGHAILAAADGILLGDPDDALRAVTNDAPRLVSSLDKLGLQLPSVAAIALDGAAMRARSWAGAINLIRRDRPLLLLQVAGLCPEEVRSLDALDYDIRILSAWSYPGQCPILALATPKEATSRQKTQDFLIAPPSPASRFGAHPGTVTLADVIEPSKLQAAGGLYAAERSGGTEWAWTGPTKRTDLLLPQLWFGLQNMTLQVHATYAHNGLGALQFYVDGQEASVRIEGDHCVVIQASVLASTFTGTTRLSIVTPNLRASSGDDERRIGTSLGNLELGWA